MTTSFTFTAYWPTVPLQLLRCVMVSYGEQLHHSFAEAEVCDRGQVVRVQHRSL